MVTLVKYQGSFKDEMKLDGEEEKELYLNDALKEVIEGLDEGELLLV